MIILGLNSSPHDRSAVLVKDGKILIGIEEERLTREKHSITYDQKYYNIESDGEYFLKTFLGVKRDVLEDKLNLSINYCLKNAGLSAKDIDYIASSNFFLNTPFKEKNIIVNHHLCHAANAYYLSGFKNASILIVDGIGDINNGKFETISFYKADRKKIDRIKEISGEMAMYKNKPTNSMIAVTNSLGAFYKNVTALIGFGNFGEGITMGLAPYGKPIYKNLLDKFVKETDTGIKIDNKGIYLELRELIKNKNIDLQDKANIAASCQEIFDKLILHLVNLLYELNPSENLCLAGGCFLNAVANSSISEFSKFKNVFVPPTPGDNGTSIGAALYTYHNLTNAKKYTPINSDYIYLGKEYKESEIKKSLKKYENNLIYKKSNNITKNVANLLAARKIIGWFQGRSEFGPRALGNRSILANPDTVEIRDFINKEVKIREDFRPLAPSVLAEYAKEYFNFGNKEKSSTMLFTFAAKNKALKETPAIVHVDGSSRIQTVTRKDNPLYYSLISEFYKLTKIPLLLNTSLNKKEPIVESPEDAIKTFINSKLDYLVVHNYIISKKSI